MSSLYFPKPQPLSPLPTARWKMEINEATGEFRYYQLQKGKKKPVKGVELSESIYYWWFEYLKLSDKYQRVCGLDVQLTSEWFIARHAPELVNAETRAALNALLATPANSKSLAA